MKTRFLQATIYAAIIPFLLAGAQTHTQTPAAQAGQPQFKLRTQTNAVVVRVVVRDSKGRAVSGLQKQDFRIFDNKKPQTITSFSVETPEAATLPAQSSAVAPAAKVGREAITSPAAQVSHLAFYFDDLYSTMSSLVRARKAAEKFLAGLPASEQVAIFTSSGTQTLDFTDDRQKLHDALMKLRVNKRVNPRSNCPEISDYLARQIVDYNDQGAYDVISDEAYNVCHWSQRMAINKNLLREQAQEAYDAYRFQSLAVLKNLQGVIDRMATLPGERQVMQVSDGFINLGSDTRVETLVDRALRERVTISALDAKGMALNMPEMNARRSYMPSPNRVPQGNTSKSSEEVSPMPNLSAQVQAYNSSREADATGTLAEIAEGTGGQFFHNNNDLLSGMRKILMSPAVSYVLTFSPSDLKSDGAFHVLKVTLAKGHGLTIQARKGYFAPKGQVTPEELARNDIREAMHSPYPIQGLPLTVQTEAHKTEAENEEIEVQAQLGIHNLPFEKKGGRSVDNVVFAVGLFDHDGKYVTGRQLTYALALKDSLLAEKEKRGFGLKTRVSAKTGAYTLRVVVRDSQGGMMAALSKAVEVPSQTSAPAAQQVVPLGQGVVSGAQVTRTAAPNKAVAAPSHISAPAAQQVVPSGQGVVSATQGGRTAVPSKAPAVSSKTPAPAAQPVAPGDEAFFKVYRRAAPITKWRLKKIRHRIPELKGLEPATDQSQLPEILRRVSANLQKFVVNFADTTALETVRETEASTYGAAGVMGTTGMLPMARTITEKFRYLIMAQREGGTFTMVEYRTNLGGREEHPLAENMGFITTTGFAAMPLFFGPLQQPWSDFRYLGQQEIDGVSTDVVAFAEHVEPAAVMGHLLVGGKSAPLLVQGVAWIRTSDYQIVQMRTDLLARVRSLRRMTAVAHFAEDRLPDSPKVFWLPKEVEVRIELGDHEFSNRHSYSDYRLFRVKSVIKAGP